MAADSSRLKPVECSVLIEAGPEVVFRYFTDPRKIIAWMGSEAMLNPVPGGAYRVSLPIGYTIVGEFEAVDPPQRVVFSWGWDHEETLVPPGASRVEVDLEPVEDGTRVLLRHTKLGPESAAQHTIGWVHYLERLRVAAAGGEPGPDEGPRAGGGRGERP